MYKRQDVGEPTTRSAWQSPLTSPAAAMDPPKKLFATALEIFWRPLPDFDSSTFRYGIGAYGAPTAMSNGP